MDTLPNNVEELPKQEVSADEEKNPQPRVTFEEWYLSELKNQKRILENRLRICEKMITTFSTNPEVVKFAEMSFILQQSETPPPTVR